MSETFGEAAAAGRGARPQRWSAAARLYLETESGVELPPRGRGRRYWIVARGLCRFFKVPLLADAPRARRLDALALEIKRLSPFEETASHVHLGRDFAGVWLWDQRATRAAGAGIGVDVSRLRVLPEPAMRPYADRGVRLTETLDGFEAQEWQDSCLVASRWWRHVPEDRAWVLFQRGASVRPDRLVPMAPAPLRLSWLRRPWTKTRPAGRFDPTLLDMRLAAAGIAAAMMIAYGYEGAQFLHASRAVGALAKEIELRSAALEPVLAARTQALDNRAAIRTLHDLDRFPSQLTLMARVADLLPGVNTRLTAWLYDRGQLDLDIAADQPLDVVSLVRALERVDYFKSVAAERTGTNNTLRLRVTIAPL